MYPRRIPAVRWPRSFTAEAARADRREPAPRSWLLIGGVALVLLGSLEAAEARTQSGAVYADGQVQRSGAGVASCGSNDDLVFTFTESVTPDVLDLERRDREQAQAEVRVVIDEVCEPGQANFDYAHRSVAGGGEIGVDIAIQPRATSIVVPIEPGASGSAQVTYEALPLDDPGPDDKRFELVATGIGFIAGQIFGNVQRDEALAAITVIEDPGPPLPPPQIPDQGSRLGDAGGAFNEACAAADADSDFAAVCAEIASLELTDDEVRQIAEAFDPHELAAIPTASSEGGRIQTANVNTRIAELRSGATGVSLSGVALAYNGQTFDTSWLPADALDEAGGGGSSLLSDRLGAFVNGEISLGERDRRGKEVGFDFDSWGITAGVDYRLDSGSFFGLSLGWSEYDADIDADGGSTDAETITVQGYGSYSFTDAFYVDATLGWSSTDVTQRRVVDLSGIGSLTRTVARGSTDARQYSASLVANYRVALEGAWSVTPYGEFLFAWNDIDGFRETGSPFALEFDDQDFSSETLGLGLRASRAISFESGVLSPYLDASFRHESGNDGYLLEPRLFEAGAFGPTVEIEDPDRNFGRVDVGASWVFLSGQQLFVSYSTLLAESDTTRHSIFFGFRGEF